MDFRLTKAYIFPLREEELITDEIPARYKKEILCKKIDCRDYFDGLRVELWNNGTYSRFKSYQRFIQRITFQFFMYQSKLKEI